MSTKIKPCYDSSVVWLRPLIDDSVYSSGIGYATIRILLKRGAKVYMGARSEAKAKKAIEKLTAEGLGSGAVHYVNVDLSDPVKAKADAEAFLRIETRLDILSMWPSILLSIFMTHNVMSISQQRGSVGIPACICLWLPMLINNAQDSQPLQHD